MRCIAGIVMFLVLYFSLCTIIGGAAQQWYGPRTKAEVLRKYHAAVAVGCGVVTLFACALPSILAKHCKDDEWMATQ
jgi:hypothetical protein